LKVPAWTTGPRFRWTLYGFGQLLRFTASRDAPFARRLAEGDFSLVMSSGEKRSSRHYQVRGGRVSSRGGDGPADFRLIWRDEPAGCRVMTDMVLGKRHALRDAVIQGDLLLEGDAALVGRFLEIVNHLGRVYRRGRGKRPEPGGPGP